MLRCRGLRGGLIGQRRDVLHAPEPIREARGHRWRNPHGLGMIGGVGVLVSGEPPKHGMLVWSRRTAARVRMEPK